MDDKNEGEIAEEPMEEEIPKILQPLTADIFHNFANMLDVKSFMKLAMSCTDMFSRCMLDRSVRICIVEDTVVMRPDKDGFPSFTLNSIVVEKKNIDAYLKTLRKIRCDVSLECLVLGNGFQNQHLLDNDCLMATRNFTEEIGVKNIRKLSISAFTNWEALPKFVADFEVQELTIFDRIPDDIIRSLLQLNLNSFTYEYDISAELFLDVTSTIPVISFKGLRNCNKDLFMQILWKIQTGPLVALTISHPNIDLSLFEIVPFDDDGPITDQRPLVFRRGNVHNMRTYWFLHWHGGVTKCTAHTFHQDDSNFIRIDISKCEPSDYPPVLKSKEEVWKQLSESNRAVLCNREQFTSYFEDISTIDSSYTGSFPEERPLVCKENDERLWLLAKDDVVKRYYWENGSAAVDFYNMEVQKSGDDWVGLNWPKPYSQPALMKYVFHRMIQEINDGTTPCPSVESFNSLFEEFKSLPYNFHGPLPEERPLIFEKTVDSEDNDNNNWRYKNNEIRAILLANGDIKECHWDGYMISLGSLSSRPHKFPSALISAQILKEIICNAPFDDGQRFPKESFEYHIDLDVFRDAYTELKPLSFDYDGQIPNDSPLVFEKTLKIDEDTVVEERYIVRDYFVTKGVWSDGVATFVRCENQEIPVAATKHIIKSHLKGDWNHRSLEISDFFLDASAFSDCSKEFKKLPHDFSGPLPVERPLFFEKTDVKHCCDGTSTSCSCTDKILRFWSLCEDDSLKYCSWSEKEEGHVRFTRYLDGSIVPSVLKTRQFFVRLMEKQWAPNKYISVNFYGEKKIFVNYFASKRFSRVRHGHENPLPKQRPLVISGQNYRWLIRADETVIKCRWHHGEDYTEISLSSRSHITPRWYSRSYRRRLNIFSFFSQLYVPGESDSED